METKEDLMQKVKTIVQDNLSDKNFNLFVLATQLHMSERHLSRIIKKETGVSPGVFIRSIRLEQAVLLLKSGRYQTVSEVANAVGFEKTSHFSKIYSERFHRRPSEYFDNQKN